MTPISLSTHVLDTARGVPVEGIPVLLERLVDGGWAELASAATDADGRVADLGGEAGGQGLLAGTYRLVFGLRGTPATADSWYPEVSIVVDLQDGSGHAHVPLLLAPYGYSTYRGS